MYTGKEGDRPSGLFQDNEDVDSPNEDVLLLALERTTAPNDDVLLLALERTTALFDR